MQCLLYETFVGYPTSFKEATRRAEQYYKWLEQSVGKRYIVEYMRKSTVGRFFRVFAIYYTINQDSNSQLFLYQKFVETHLDRFGPSITSGTDRQDRKKSLFTIFQTATIPNPMPVIQPSINPSIEKHYSELLELICFLQPASVME